MLEEEWQLILDLVQLSREAYCRLLSRQGDQHSARETGLRDNALRALSDYSRCATSDSCGSSKAMAMIDALAAYNNVLRTSNDASSLTTAFAAYVEARGPTLASHCETMGARYSALAAYNNTLRIGNRCTTQFDGAPAHSPEAQAGLAVYDKAIAVTLMFALKARHRRGGSADNTHVRAVLEATLDAAIHVRAGRPRSKPAPENELIAAVAEVLDAEIAARTSDRGSADRVMELAWRVASLRCTSPHPDETATAMITYARHISDANAAIADYLNVYPSGADAVHLARALASQATQPPLSADLALQISTKLTSEDDFAHAELRRMHSRDFRRRADGTLLTWDDEDAVEQLYRIPYNQDREIAEYLRAEFARDDIFVQTTATVDGCLETSAYTERHRADRAMRTASRDACARAKAIALLENTLNTLLTVHGMRRASSPAHRATVEAAYKAATVARDEAAKALAACVKAVTTACHAVSVANDRSLSTDELERRVPESTYTAIESAQSLLRDAIAARVRTDVYAAYIALLRTTPLARKVEHHRAYFHADEAEATISLALTLEKQRNSKPTLEPAVANALTQQIAVLAARAERSFLRDIEAHRGDSAERAQAAADWYRIAAEATHEALCEPICSRAIGLITDAAKSIARLLDSGQPVLLSPNDAPCPISDGQGHAGLEYRPAESRPLVCLRCVAVYAPDLLGAYKHAVDALYRAGGTDRARSQVESVECACTQAFLARAWNWAFGLREDRA